MARGRANIANTALRIFLQEMGAAYDEERGLTPWRGAKDLPQVVEFFGGRCCYCDAEFAPGNPAVQDHLIPINKTDLGLHAWGNVVPSCGACNAKKLGSDWRDFIIQRAGFTLLNDMVGSSSSSITTTTDRRLISATSLPSFTKKSASSR